MNTEHTDHQNQPADRPDGAGTDRAWESAMSRDFDARVRGLTEAPLSLDVVKGKAVRIRRNRRIAAAGGALAVAAAVTPIALVATSNGDTDPDLPTATQTAEDPGATQPDYIRDGVWHQADGDKVDLPPGDYYAAAAIWDGQLVTQRPEEQDVSRTVTEVWDADGTFVDGFLSNQGLAVGEDGAFFAHVSDDGLLQSRSADGEITLADGLDSNMVPVAAIGDPACGQEADTCSVYVNDGDGAPQVFSSHGTRDVVTPDARIVHDAQGSLVTLIDSFDETVPETCGGLYDLSSGEFAHHGCDYQWHQISPDGRFVAATQTYFDGFGPGGIIILDAETGEEAGRYFVDGLTVTTWEWATDGRLVFQGYDGANWHLYAMAPYADGGGVEELADPVRGSDFESAYTLIQH